MRHRVDTIFVLGQEIANAMKDIEPSASKRIAERMHELALKTEKEIDEEEPENSRFR